MRAPLGRREPWLSGMSVIVGLTASSCGDNWETQTSRNQGTLCISSDQSALNAFNETPAQRVASNSVVFVGIASPCMSGSCDRNASGTCQVQLDGQQISVTSEFEWETNRGSDQCTADCQRTLAICATPPLPSGHYTVQHGVVMLSLNVPGVVTVPCVGDR
jgi:hypothetical protein